MKTLRPVYSLPLLCRTLKVSRSGYYTWLHRKLSKHAQDEARLEIEIRAANERTRGTYGPERLQKDLAEHGINAGISRIRRIRKKAWNTMQTGKEIQSHYQFKTHTAGGGKPS